MNKIRLLHEYYEALCKIHPHQAFWIFDDNWVIVEANSLDYCFNNFRVYSYYADDVLSAQELLCVIKQHTGKDSIYENNVELLAFYQSNDMLHSLILESIPIRHDEDIIGYLMLNVGNLCDFEASNVVNMILFGASKKTKSGVSDGTRLLEISFFLIRGKNYREIAEILSKIHNKRVASSTIGNLVRNFLYPRFNVCNRMALKKAIHRSDIYAMLPKTIFKELRS